jgi:hypothetical protein
LEESEEDNAEVRGRLNKNKTENTHKTKIVKQKTLTILSLTEKYTNKTTRKVANVVLTRCKALAFLLLTYLHIK